MPFALPRIAPGADGRVVLSALACATACGGDDGGVLRPFDRTPPQPDIHASWIGTYHGDGVGTAGGSAVEIADATLRVRFDADTVLDAACVRCVTVTLDTLFVKANVDPSGLTDLIVLIEDGVESRRLEVSRFSATGLRRDAVAVRLRIAGAQGTPVQTDLRFVLERR